MDPRLEPIAQIYVANNSLFDNARKGIPDCGFKERINDKGNSYLWVAGHIVSSRYRLACLIGLYETWEHAELFKRGADVHPPELYPSMDEIIEAMTAVTKNLTETFETLTAEKLDEAIPDGYPVMRNTVLFGISFLALHECYHVGQLAYIRRLHGQDRLVG
ncbi:MAG TPA: DinB family protein [candidate division Zixibacteria bacterium]|nr:DinB family protein [candidate division Zixibacteria bacterium]